MAMSSINLVVLTGGLTRDVEVKTGKDRNGRDLYTCSFGLGVTKTSREKDGGWKDESMYHNCYYLTSSEKLLPLLTRGTQVLVTGSLNQYVGKDGQRVNCITVKDLRLIGAPRNQQNAHAQCQNNNASAQADDDEFMPF